MPIAFEDRAERADATPITDDPLPGVGWRGPFPGTVVSTADPLRRGRVRVRAPQVYGASEQEQRYIPDDQLPWARPAFPCHDLHAGYQTDDGVWIIFWGEDSSEPVILGQWLGESENEDVPEEFTSSYTPDPKTRLIRTSNGHKIEMRWVEGEEKLVLTTAGGICVELLDADALGGSLFRAKTPGGFEVVADEKERKTRIVTPLQKVELDESVTPPQVAVETPGDVNVTAQGATNQQFLGGAANAFNFVSQATILFGAALALTVAGTLSITVATIAFMGALTITLPATLALTAVGAITLTGSAVAIGSAGAKLRLCNESLITAVININAASFNGHVHVSAAAGAPTGTPVTPGLAPVVFVPGVLGTHTTTATTAN